MGTELSPSAAPRRLPDRLTDRSGYRALAVEIACRIPGPWIGLFRRGGTGKLAVNKDFEIIASITGRPHERLNVT